MRKSVIIAGIIAGLTTAVGAMAQEAGGQTGGQANVGMSLPGATPATAAPGASDHDQMVGRLAVGYLGRATVGAGSLAIGAGPPADNPEGYAVVGVAPVVGVRYWVNSMLGIDAGIGIALIGGSIEETAPDNDVDLDSFTGFIFHAGVPLALASTDHFTFEIVPEANVGIGSAEQADGDITHNGFHLDLGARAGAEIHFGFIKIPQLSLQGSVGLQFALDSGSTDINPPGAVAPPDTIERSRTALQTTVGSNPWNIFTSNVAALYYF
jgi:hypothetical protein